jgi:hypothetical protein
MPKHTYSSRQVIDADENKRTEAQSAKEYAFAANINISRCITLADAKRTISAAILERLEAASVVDTIFYGQPAFDEAAAENWPGVEKRGIASGVYPDDLVTARLACHPSCPLCNEQGHRFIISGGEVTEVELSAHPKNNDIYPF